MYDIVTAKSPSNPIPSHRAPSHRLTRFTMDKLHEPREHPLHKDSSLRPDRGWPRAAAGAEVLNIS